MKLQPFTFAAFSIIYSNMTYVQNLLIQQQISDKEALRRDTLIQVAKRLHDQNDVSSVLNVLLMDLEQLYPHAKVDLYLSQDHVNGDPRVKAAVVRHAAADSYAKAFLDGKPIIEHGQDNRRRASDSNGWQASGVWGAEYCYEQSLLG